MPTVGPDQRYRLMRCLGRGGMGEVHLAVARGAAGFEKLVAVKLLDDRVHQDRAQTRALLREAFLGVQLDHENIVQVLDLGEDDGRYFVVMEYVRGFTLAHVIAHLDAVGQSMPLGAALHVARSTLDALGYLHRLRGADGALLGLIHGDVSPSNVLLAGDGRVKLSDFGVASFGADQREPGTIAGKLPYLPPEAFAGAARSQAWDVYATAALLYETIAGVPAFPGTSLDAIRTALRRGAPPLAAHRPDVPPALAAVIEQALSFHLERRPGGVPELRAAIEEAVPRGVGDADLHRTLIASVYRDDLFVQEHGELPTTPSGPEELVPVEITTTAVGPKTVGRTRPRALRFGISPAIGAAQARVVGDRFATYLRDRLQHEVRPVVLADYAMLVSCLVQGEIDLAWMPPTAFVSAAEHGAGVLAKIQRVGQTTYEAAVIARVDGGVRELADLRGKPIAWVDRDSASGYWYAFHALRKIFADPDAELGEQSFVGSHRAVCEAVAKGWAAAGATYASRDADGTVVSAGWLDLPADRAAQVAPLWFSTPIPGDSIAHRPFLPDPLVRAVSDALFGLGDSDEGRALLAEVFHAQGFVPAHISDYDRVRDAMT